MVSATGNAQASTANILLSAPTSNASLDSFAQQLATTLEQYLGQSQNGSQVELDIQPATAQSGDSGQFVITVKTAQPAGASTSQAATVSTTAGSLPAGSTGGQPDGFVQVPFGNTMITVPSLATELAQQNAIMATITPAAIIQQDQLSAAGDPMAGQMVPGTNLNWDNLTQDQQLAYLYADNYGLPSGETMQDYLTANVGPHTMANAPSKNPTLFGNA